MPNESQHDPNVPNPDEPWCPKCEAHVDFEIKHQSVSSSSAGLPGTILIGASHVTPKFS